MSLLLNDLISSRIQLSSYWKYGHAQYRGIVHRSTWTSVIVLWYHIYTCTLAYTIYDIVQMNVHSAGGNLLFIEDRCVHDT